MPRSRQTPAPAVARVVLPSIAKQRDALLAAVRDHLRRHGDRLTDAVHGVVGDTGAALVRDLRTDIRAAKEWHSGFGRRLGRILRLLDFGHVDGSDGGPARCRPARPPPKRPGRRRGVTRCAASPDMRRSDANAPRLTPETVPASPQRSRR